MKKTFIEKAQEFKGDLLNDLQMIGLEQLQKDSMYLVANEENEMTQNEIENFFETSDWEDGIIASISNIASYLKLELTEEVKEYIHYLENK